MGTPDHLNALAEDRTYARLLARSEQRGDCLVWLGQKDDSGYGVLNVGKRKFKVHRISYAHFYKDLERGKFVLHSCDTPACFAKDHLSQGTHEDNMRDMVNKGRAGRAFGKKNGRAKYEDSVPGIRRDFVEGLTRAQISSKYGVSWSQVDNIANNKSWV